MSIEPLVFATNNNNKVEEIRAVLKNGLKLVSLKEAGIDIDIPEPHDSLEKNASEKSHTIYRLTGRDCFSEDTGLEVVALNGAPGVKSARYAGENGDSKKNIAKLLSNMEAVEDRRAQFKTVISLMLNGKEHQFTGICKGTITYAESGNSGFGYDPVFIPEGDTRTFAEMDIEEKNRFSHRKQAVARLIEFLNVHYGKD